MRTLIAVVTCVLLVGCGKRDTREAVADEMVALINEMNAVLDGVRDEPSAKAAAPKLKMIGDQFEALGARMDALGKATETESAAMEKYVRDRASEPTKKVMANMMRIGLNPKLRPHLDDAMKSFGKSSPRSPR